MKLAGIAFEVNCSYYSTKEYCASYFTEDAPLFVLNITQEDIEHEHSLLDYPASAPYAEQLALYRAICEKLCAYDIFLLHGSAIAVDGETYIFIAPSGTGKSTHTALWRKALQGQHDIVMVNDDKPLIQVTKNGVFACGTPWSGTYGLNTDVSSASHRRNAARAGTAQSDDAHGSLLVAWLQHNRGSRIDGIPRNEERKQHMKLKSEMIAQNMDDSLIVVSLDKNVFPGVATANKTAGFIIEQLRRDTTPEKIKQAMFDKYDAPYEEISADVDNVIAKLRENGIIEE